MEQELPSFQFLSLGLETSRPTRYSSCLQGAHGVIEDTDRNWKHNGNAMIKGCTELLRNMFHEEKTFETFVRREPYKELAERYLIWRWTWTQRNFPMAQTVKNLPAKQGIRVRFLGQEDPLEKEMANHFSILAWEIPWTEEPGRLQSMGSQRLGHDWATNTLTWKQRHRNKK